MRKKFGVLAALAAVTAKVGIAGGAHAQEAEDFQLRCELYQDIEDRNALQAELEQLIELRPEDPCIGFIVDLLGGSPLAQLLPPYS